MSVVSWQWRNTTQVCFGENAVADHMKDFVTPKSRVLCVFGGGSINKNGVRNDVQSALDTLGCEVRWEGGIPQLLCHFKACNKRKVIRFLLLPNIHTNRSKIYNDSSSSSIKEWSL